MPLCSMTGFGRASVSGATLRVDVELATVNRKQLDVSLVIPRCLAPWEADIQRRIHARLHRGSVKAQIRVLATGAAEPSDELLAAASSQIALLRALASRLNLPDDLAASSLLASPKSVLAEGDAAFRPADLPLLETALDQALDALCAMRRREGAALEADLLGHLDRLRAMLAPIRERVPLVAAAHRDAMLRRLAEAGLPLPADDPSIVREIAVYADRCDVSEELARLESHFAQADALFAGTAPCGRELDFLCQEFHREINTLGTKAADATISAVVVRFKASLEAFREQVQNIE